MAKKPEVLTLKVVRFTTLKNAKLFDGTFDKVSYGDAAYTLVGAAQLYEELAGLDDKSLAPLIKELRELPETDESGAFIYVALDG